MSTPWSATALSVSPPSHQMASADRTAFTFSAGETITTATAVLSILPGFESAAGSILSTTPGANNAVVVVHNLTRGATYKLAVTFTRADLTRWTRTLVIICED